MKIKQIVSYFVAFIIMLSTVALLPILVCGFTLGNKGYYLAALNKAQYYEGARNKIQNIYYNLGLASDVPKSVTDEAVTLNDIKARTGLILDQSFQYVVGASKSSTIAVNTTVMEANLRKSILNYTNSQYITVDPSIQSAIDAFVTNCKIGYQSVLSPIPDTKDVLPLLQTGYRLILKLFYTACAVLVFTIALCVAVNFRRPRASLFYIFSGFLSGSFISGIISSLVILSRYPYRINLSDQYLKIAFGDLIYGFLTDYLIASAVVFFLSSIFLVLLRWFKINKSNLRTKESEFSS
jgi:hypothetical protein